MSWIESDVYWIIDVSSWILCSLLILSMLAFHSVKVCQDLCTKERKSISHRSKNPEINKIYIIITFVSYLSILMYTISLIVGVIANFSVLSSSCNILAIFFPIFWQIAKCGLYLVLLLRLHTVYNKSQYEYNPKTLIFVGIITIIINGILFIFLCISSKSDGYSTYKFSQTAIVCNFNIPEWLLYGSALYDVIMSVSCLLAFIIPLKKLIETIPNRVPTISKSSLPSSSTTLSITSTSSKPNNKMTDKGLSRSTARLAMIGMKFLIVTMTAVLTSLFMLIIAGITDSFIITSYDMLINSICIILMTPYYNDKIYYNRLCFCCINCCTKCKYYGMNDKFQVITYRITKDLSVSTTNLTTTATDIGNKYDDDDGNVNKPPIVN